MDRLLFQLMALNTSGNWVAGDELRVIEALRVPFGEYGLSCVEDCMNELEVISASAVLNVRTLLDEYENANTLDSSQNAEDIEGKVLVKADVLEWEVMGGKDGLTGPQKEMNKARFELWNYFSFCSCISMFNPDGGFGSYGSGNLVRS